MLYDIVEEELANYLIEEKSLRTTKQQVDKTAKTLAKMKVVRASEKEKASAKHLKETNFGKSKMAQKVGKAGEAVKKFAGTKKGKVALGVAAGAAAVGVGAIAAKKIRDKVRASKMKKYQGELRDATTPSQKEAVKQKISNLQAKMKVKQESYDYDLRDYNITEEQLSYLVDEVLSEYLD